MKFNIFEKKENKSRLPLNHYISNCKKYYGDDMFVTIWNDLDTDTFLGDPFAEMTYAYSRRTIGALLYLQGHFNAKEVAIQQEVFQNFQVKTDASYEFQESAGAASCDFLKEYSDWFTKEKIGVIVSMVISGKAVDLKSMGLFRSADDVMKTLDDTIMAVSALSNRSTT